MPGAVATLRVDGMNKTTAGLGSCKTDSQVGERINRGMHRFVITDGNERQEGVQSPEWLLSAWRLSSPARSRRPLNRTPPHGYSFLLFTNGKIRAGIKGLRGNRRGRLSQVHGFMSDQGAHAIICRQPWPCLDVLRGTLLPP